MQQALIALDCETWPITDRDLAPPLVCATTFTRGSSISFTDIVATGGTWTRIGNETFISDHDRVQKSVADTIGDTSIVIVGHRICYDLAVILRRFTHLRLVVGLALGQGRIRDTRIREAVKLGYPEPWLAGLGDGGEEWKTQIPDRGHGLSLAPLALQYTGAVIKSSGWATRFRELDGVSVKTWPQDAIAYCCGDVEQTHAVFLAQGEHDEREHLLRAWREHEVQVERRRTGP